LLACATLIIKFRNSKEKNLDGIQLVLSNKEKSKEEKEHDKSDDNDAGGWNDPRSVQDLYLKVIPLVRGLDTSLTEQNATDLTKKWFKVRRIGTSFGPNSIHTKTICVDKQLLYIGSDNLYPSYNEEHGIWVDDKAALSDWVNNYWNRLWPNTSEPAGKDCVASNA
jgi:hypothetical protein